MLQRKFVAGLIREPMKRIVLYPFLFVLYAVLNPLATNLDQIQASQALRPLAALLLLAGLSMAAIGLATRNLHKAGFITFLGLVFVLAFGHLYRLVWPWLSQAGQDPALVVLFAWGLLIFGVGLWVGRSRAWQRAGGERITGALNLALAIALIVPAVEVPAALIQAGTDLPDTGSPELQEDDLPAVDCAESPDIYYLILDGYGRSDALARLYGIDNTGFLAELEQRGFFVARQSHTNYTQTIFSIPSALNFRYIGPNPEGVSGTEYFGNLIANNRMLALLEGCGYRTVALESGFSFTEQPEVDVYLEQGSPLNPFENLLLADSPVDLLAGELTEEGSEYSFKAHRERVLYSFEQLRRLPQMAGPKFVFAHLLIPHPPFVFTAEGEPVEPGYSYALGDGDDYPGSRQEYREGYAAQVQVANRLILETIDAIQADNERPAVILLQGDHGPGGLLDWDAPEESCLWERTGIFNAYYLPGKADAGLYSQISPVNSFRVVLNAYFDAGLGLLPDRSYFTSHRLDRTVIDITGRRSLQQNCAWPQAGPEGDAAPGLPQP